MTWQSHIRFTKGGRATTDHPEMLAIDFGDDGATRVIVMAARV